MRAVADFPNVGYLLAYDPRNLAKCIERATGLENGKTYIEKFVQASFKVPAPMSIDLKAWLTAETQEVAGHIETTRRAAERLRQAVSCWCAEYIATPRDVVRVANALRLYAAPVAERIDLADGLFIQIIRIHRPELHDWIERYVTARFAFDASDAHSAWLDSESERSRDLGSEISSAAGKEDEELDRLVGEIRRHLPELRTSRVFDPRQFGTEERRRYAAEAAAVESEPFPAVFRSFDSYRRRERRGSTELSRQVRRRPGRSATSLSRALRVRPTAGRKHGPGSYLPAFWISQGAYRRIGSRGCWWC